MDNQAEFKWTVFYKDPITGKLAREHFVHKTGSEGAVSRCNFLLRRGYKAWLRTYSPAKRPVDYAAERGPRG